MARVNNEIQQHEVDAVVQFCDENNIVFDSSESGVANARLLHDYFTQTWDEVITPETLATAFPQLRPRLKFKSAARLECDKIAAANPAAAQQLVAWLNTQGKKPGQLANSVDDAYYANLTLLLAEISGRREDVSSTTIRNAIDRISNRPGRKLHYVEAPRRTEPVSAAAKADDSTSANWLGRDMVKNSDGSLRSKTPAEQRADREAVENAKQMQTATSLSKSDQQWKSMALEACRYGTHSEQAQISRVFEQCVGAPWREVYEAVNQVRNALKRKKELMPA